MKAFSERNPITIAVVGLVTMLVIGLGAYYADDLPIIGGGDTYTADFSDAGGLKSGDDVLVAGVQVGKVKSISLVKQHVRVDFKVKDAWIGNESTAAIGIKTLLGQEFVAIDPAGTRKLKTSEQIPVSRTTTPVDVYSALSGLSTTTGDIDTTQLANSFNVLSSAFSGTSSNIKSALTGLSALSRTISSRDAALSSLSASAKTVTGSLVKSNKQFASLIDDGALLVQELQARSAAITQLLDGTRTLATQVSGLVRDNEKTLKPALQQLSKVTAILLKNQGNLKKGLALIGPYYTLLNDATGSGRWIDVYICGLFDSSKTPILDPNVTRNCAPKAGS